MSFLRRLFGGDQSPDRLRASASDRPPDWMRDGMQVQLYDGRTDLEVVGESHYQDNLWRLVGGRGFPEERVRVDAVAVLAAETDNPYDANAVAVWVRGLKVGYLSRADAQRYRPGLVALQRKHGMPIALAGVIVGGGMRPDGPGMLGVFLRHDPKDFGLRAMPPPPPPGSTMRTGLSDAVATDEADDSYDLGWINDLPADDIRAITMLRQFLARESDPVDRHFMYAHLEDLLYRSRDAFMSAEAAGDRDAALRQLRASVPTNPSARPEAAQLPGLSQRAKWRRRLIGVTAGDCELLTWPELSTEVHGCPSPQVEAKLLSMDVDLGVLKSGPLAVNSAVSPDRLRAAASQCGSGRRRR